MATKVSLSSVGNPLRKMDAKREPRYIGGYISV